MPTAIRTGGAEQPSAYDGRPVCDFTQIVGIPAALWRARGLAFTSCVEVAPELKIEPS